MEPVPVELMVLYDRAGPPPNREGDDGQGGASPSEAGSVLVVEDEPAHAQLIRRAFERASPPWQVLLATSLTGAREVLATRDVSLVLADMRLPDGNGLDLVASQPESPARPLVAMTSHGDEGVAVGALRAGALNYVVKSADAFAAMPHVAARALREWNLVRQGEQAREAVRRAADRYRALYEGTPAMFFTVGPDKRLISVNAFGAESLGYAVADIVGRPVRVLYDRAQWPEVARNIERCYAEPGAVHRWETGKRKRDGKILQVRETGRVFDDGEGKSSLLLVSEDITDAYELSRQLAHQVSHDSLTGLVNRTEFEARLERLLASVRAAGGEHALCYMDLDDFKIINDTCGHPAGDELLAQLGVVLGQHVRGRDTLARLGGDEFGVLLEHCPLHQACKVAHGLRGAIEDFRFSWKGKSFRLGASIGVTMINSDTRSSGAVLGAADAACYAAKERGRNCVHLYREDDAELARRHREMQWVSRLQHALEAGDFVLYYQPIVPVGEVALPGAPRHCEVLVRMVERETGRHVPPGAFLPAAERYNLAPALDRWVVVELLSWLARTPRALETMETFSVNISGTSLADESLLRFIVDGFRDHGVDVRKLCFEITETAAVANLAAAIEFVRTLRDLGCRFALDDFGSGLSSFAYLKRLPVDFLKIDGLFVKDMVTDALDRTLVKSINELSHVMGKKTIAEFVESPQILELLREIGVDYAQGFGIGEPQPLSSLADGVRVPGA